MLELKNIVKQYVTGDTTLNALDDVSLEFRKNEFVAILGPSGCGKTTMLNIVGGLDRYTSGDIVINGKSTKEFKDADWDNYRNHSIGFVFQSYNLIPHQTVLENVELALTLSGVSKEERRKRATDVLTKVGLADKLKNKPNQLSGGQMQRVAIARALVNDPEIILADEPTGALDTVSSIQVMELLKEISKDKLIIMVTHNPELAQEYSTRIVKLLDGQLIDDSNPYENDGKKKEKKLLSVSDDTSLTKRELEKKNKKKKMSFFTALSLSFKNLLTKKARTILVTFAGSIGIIGIALILSISSGFSTFVNKMQEDSLTSYPITIEAKSIDFTSVMLQMFMPEDETQDKNNQDGKIYSKKTISKIMNSVGSNLKPNNLEAFKKHIEDNREDLDKYVSAIQYTYDLGLEFYGEQSSTIPSQVGSSTLMDMVTKYALIFFGKETNINTVEHDDGSWSLTAIEGKTNFDFMSDFEVLKPVETDLRAYKTITLSKLQVLTFVFEILGFSTEDMSSMMGGGSNNAMSSAGTSIFSELLDNTDLIKSQYDLVDGKYATEPNEAMLVVDKNNEITDYNLYALGIMTYEQLGQSLKALVYEEKDPVAIDYSSVINKKTYKVLAEHDYYRTVNGEVIDIRDLNKRTITDPTNPTKTIPNPIYDAKEYAKQYSAALNESTNEIKIVGILRPNETTENGSIKSGVVYLSSFTTQMVNKHAASLGSTSGKLQPLETNKPSSIKIYVNSFESKESVVDFISNYNEVAEQGDEISYTDMVGILMGTVSTIITSITYVLIAFVSVSLVVSSIMIGIITYISVIERTKEIGVLRSVGASKRDVKRVFTAESFIIGLASGVLGILVAALLNIPINLILKAFTGLSNIAVLPVVGAIILVLISVGLTFIAGLMPANVAAKKDPVKALRTE
ncbi:MAG: ABC transporter ATP-binding protein/permease [Clostridia bacterium]|nr:ABC transporter ATP-binding protein/permease [Clostridia bacterium]